MDPLHPATSAESSRTPWILVVDDEPAIQNLIEAILAATSWPARIANSATQAMATIDAAASPPALLICDILMPGLDGLALTRRIVARVPGIKVILISGHLTNLSWWPTDFREYRFVAKPFSPDQLLGAVQDALINSPPAE